MGKSKRLSKEVCGWLIGALLIAIIAGSAGAQGSPLIPQEAVLVEPISSHFTQEGTSAQAVPIPQQPYVGIYKVFTPTGVRLGTSVSAMFPLTYNEMWVNGKMVLWSRYVEGIVAEQLPDGVTANRGYSTYVSTQTFLIFGIGTYAVDIRVYLTPEVYWNFKFLLEVPPFDFSVSGCVIPPDASLAPGATSSSSVMLIYYITPIGSSSLEEVSITVEENGKVLLSDVADVKNGKATLLLPKNVYYLLGGKVLDTILEDTTSGASAQKQLWYPPMANLPLCVSPPLPVPPPTQVPPPTPVPSAQMGVR